MSWLSYTLTGALIGAAIVLLAALTWHAASRAFAPLPEGRAGLLELPWRGLRLVFAGAFLSMAVDFFWMLSVKGLIGAAP